MPLLVIADRQAAEVALSSRFMLVARGCRLLPPCGDRWGDWGSAVGPEAEQKCFSPARRTVQVVIVKMLHLLGLHFHQRGLRKGVPLRRCQIHHMLGAGCMTHLLPQLRIGLHQRGKCG